MSVGAADLNLSFRLTGRSGSSQDVLRRIVIGGDAVERLPRKQSLVTASVLVLRLGQREDHNARGCRRRLPESRRGARCSGHELSAANLIGDDASANCGSSIEAI